MLEIPAIKGRPPRLLLITQDYFIIPELVRTLKRLGIAFDTVEFRQDSAFLKELFDRIASFGPHFILTVNHAGLDAEGQVLALLKRVGVPFASWFVDRPEMYFQSRADSNALLATFSWDPESISFLRGQGVPCSAYLPLGVDHHLFKPAKVISSQVHPVSFVGGSWTANIGRMMRVAKFPSSLLRVYKLLAEIYEADATPIDHLLKHVDDKARSDFGKLPLIRKKRFFRLIQLQATRLRRINAVSKLAGFNPVVVGDAYWKRVFPKQGGTFEWWSRLPYERLPGFYRDTQINFNTYSLQSSTALNQRVFDVPACGAFLLTEYNKAVEDMFDPGRDVVCFKDVDDIRDLLTDWLENPRGRQDMALAARKRVLSCHTYEHRIVELLSRMQKFFWGD